MVKLKVGRNVVDIDENDLILDNGSCYILITKKCFKGSYSPTQSYSPIVSNKLFSDLKKNGLIFTSERLIKAAIERYENPNVRFWKFNIGMMQRRIVNGVIEIL